MSEASEQPAPVRVGIVGAGTVGGGVISVLLNRAQLLGERGGVPIELVRVAELDSAKAMEAGVPNDLWVDDYRKLIADPEIDVVIELIGGTGIAAKVVRESLEAGKAVVTANKALLAMQGAELFSLAREKNLPLAFEAAVAGGIPIILALREGLVANEITSLLGILNGTCNFILTEMIGKSVAYADCLAEAQRLGFAEADPTFDVEGIDTGHKLALLSALALGTWVDFERLPVQGISGIDLRDIAFASALGYTVKLLAVARPDDKRVFLSVHPALLPQDHPLASVQGSMNAVALYGDVVMESMFYGRGAGRYPTASAVVADLVQVARLLRFGGASWTPRTDCAYELADMADYRTRYYLRFCLTDRPGAFGQLTTCLGAHGVSIASVVQHESEEIEPGMQPQGVPVVVLTHAAREGDVMNALAEVRKLKETCLADPVYLRIEE